MISLTTKKRSPPRWNKDLEDLKVNKRKALADYILLEIQRQLHSFKENSYIKEMERVILGGIYRRNECKKEAGIGGNRTSPIGERTFRDRSDCCDSDLFKTSGLSNQFNFVPDGLSEDLGYYENIG